MSSLLTLSFSMPVFASEQKLNRQNQPNHFLNSENLVYDSQITTPDLYQNSLIMPLADSYAIYAPNGGSFSNFENNKISNLTHIVYETYLPRDKVNEWIVDQVPGLRSYIISSIKQVGIAKASQVATKVLAKFGISLSVSAIVAIAQGTVFTLRWLNYKEVISASKSGKNGILVHYYANIGSGNIRSYSPWTSSYVPRKPYGGDARWHPGEYYIMP